MADVSDGNSDACQNDDSTEEKVQNKESSGKDGNVEAGVGTHVVKPNSISSGCLAIRNHFPLKSSLLGASLTSEKNVSDSSPAKSMFVLNPPRLANPFARPDESSKLGAEKTSDEAQQKNVVSSRKCGESHDKLGTGFNSNVEGTKSALSFVPLKSETRSHGSTSGPVLPPAPSLGFVFGQNLHERVVETNVGSEISRPEKETDQFEVSEESIQTNGTTSTSDMLFTTGALKETPEKPLDSGGKTLSEAAREYEEARAVKRKFETVIVVTGEEEEVNILQMNCKLFAFDKDTSSWVERGRGTLRLNDLPGSPTQSRLIVRAFGSLRVVLNTKIWSGMSVGRASLKSLRITAMDSSQIIKVFLIMASPKEIDQLQKALEWRVSHSKKLLSLGDDSPPKKSRSEQEVKS